MESKSFEAGQRIVWRERIFVLLNEVTLNGIDHWQYLPFEAWHVTGPGVGAIVDRAPSELLRQEYVEGRLVFDDRREGETPEQAAKRRTRRQVPLSEQGDKQAVMCFWRDLVRGVDREFPDGGHARQAAPGTEDRSLVLEATLTRLAAKLGVKYFGKPRGCSVATYYRWAGTLAAGNEPRDLTTDRSACGNRNEVVRKVRGIAIGVIREKLELAKMRRQVGDQPVVKMVDIMTETLTRLDEARENDPLLAEAKLPCKATFYNYYGEFQQRDKDNAANGPTRARAIYRQAVGHEEPIAALSIVQYDETKADLFCVDDLLGIPLGRPYIAWLVDVYSGAILGFYIGFEPPGDLVFGSVMRHAVLPKNYVQATFPDITAPYPMSGIPRSVTFDNSLSAHGHTIDRLMNDFDVAWNFTPSRMPWVKGDVEGMFRLLNVTLLSQMPGYVLSNRLEPVDYDPARNGVIGFHHLLWIFHKWLIERNHATSKLDGRLPSPNARWAEGTRIVKPRYPVAGIELDFMFGIVRPGRTFDHRGLVYEGLRYYGMDGHDLRESQGGNVKVKIKVNPLNLGMVHCWHPKENVWLRCQSLDPIYANGLDLHRHMLYRKYSRKNWNSESIEDFLRAKIALQELIVKGLPDALGMRTNSLIARALGIGTHTIFNKLDAQGRVENGAGVFGAQQTIPRLSTLPPIVLSEPQSRNPEVVPASGSPSAPTVRASRVLPSFAASKILRPR